MNRQHVHFDAKQKLYTHENELWSLMNAHRDGVCHIGVTDATLVSTGADSTLRVWSKETRSILGNYPSRSGSVSTAMSDVRGLPLLYSCGEDESILTFDTSKKMKVSTRMNGTITAMCQENEREYELLTTTTDGRMLICLTLAETAEIPRLRKIRWPKLTAPFRRTLPWTQVFATDVNVAMVALLDSLTDVFLAALRRSSAVARRGAIEASESCFRATSSWMHPQGCYRRLRIHRPAPFSPHSHERTEGHGEYAKRLQNKTHRLKMQLDRTAQGSPHLEGNGFVNVRRRAPRRRSR